MKNKLNILVVVMLLLLTPQKVISQDVAMNSTRDLQNSNFITYDISEESIEENALLKEGEYTFDNGNNKVLVVIKDGYYTERYSKNEFIKAKMTWTSKDEYNLVISVINKKNLPFGIGTKLNTKITKVKGDKYYYESNLEGLTWSGKFKKIK